MHPISDQNGKIYSPISDQNCLKTVPFGAAHTNMAYIWESPPPPPPPSPGHFAHLPEVNDVVCLQVDLVCVQYDVGVAAEEEPVQMGLHEYKISILHAPHLHNKGPGYQSVHPRLYVEKKPPQEEPLLCTLTSPFPSSGRNSFFSFFLRSCSLEASNFS